MTAVPQLTTNFPLAISFTNTRQLGLPTFWLAFATLLNDCANFVNDSISSAVRRMAWGFDCFMLYNLSLYYDAIVCAVAKNVSGWYLKVQGLSDFDVTGFAVRQAYDYVVIFYTGFKTFVFKRCYDFVCVHFSLRLVIANYLTATTLLMWTVWFELTVKTLSSMRITLYHVSYFVLIVDPTFISLIFLSVLFCVIKYIHSTRDKYILVNPQYGAIFKVANGL